MEISAQRGHCSRADAQGLIPPPPSQRPSATHPLPGGVPILRANDTPRTVSWYLAPFRCSLSWRRYVTNGHPAPALSSRSTRGQHHPALTRHDQHGVSTILPLPSLVTINTGSAPSCPCPHSSRSTRGQHHPVPALTRHDQHGVMSGCHCVTRGHPDLALTRHYQHGVMSGRRCVPAAANNIPAYVFSHSVLLDTYKLYSRISGSQIFWDGTRTSSMSSWSLGSHCSRMSVHSCHRQQS